MRKASYLIGKVQTLMTKLNKSSKSIINTKVYKFSYFQVYMITSLLINELGTFTYSMKGNKKILWIDTRYIK